MTEQAPEKTIKEKKPKEEKPAKAPEPTNIYERIFNIQQNVGTVMKLGYNKFHNYAYALERDIIAEVKPLLKQEKLVVTNTILSEEQVAGKDNVPGELTKLTVEFTITAIDTKEQFKAEGIGHGKDNGDKGAAKALTAALKYFLTKTFLIETGDDPENDQGQGAGAAPAAAAGKKGNAPAPQAAAPQQKDATQAYEAAKRMIKATRNVQGLIEYSENLKNGKTFNEVQKKELLGLVTARVDEIENPAQ